MVLFETERLICRRLNLKDREAMMAIYGDLETVKFVGDSQPLTLDECTHWIEVTDKNFERRGYGMVGLLDRHSQELIGCAGIVHPDQQEEAEVKYAFRRDQWGKGFATEAISSLIHFGKQNWNLERLIATTHPENENSHKVLRKLGFVLIEDLLDEEGIPTRVWELRE